MKMAIEDVIVNGAVTGALTLGVKPPQSFIKIGAIKGKWMKPLKQN